MSRSVRDRFVLKIAVLGLMIFVGSFGCGHSTPKPPEISPAMTQLYAIQRAYIDATISYNRPPSNKDELAPYLKDPADREKTAKPEDILISATDGEEFVIHWGFDFRHEDLSGDTTQWPVLAYEKTGKDGKRLVSQIRVVREATAEQLAAPPFPEGFRPPR